MPHVFVTDAQRRKSLAVVRSLGRKGIQVTAGEEFKSALASYSKYCHRAVVYPSPTETPGRFIEWLIEHLKRHTYTAIFPTNEQTLTPIAQHLAEISQYATVPIADYDTYMKARDKSVTLKIAAEHGIPCPKTDVAQTLDEAKQIAKQVGYPLVIKPREGTGSSGVTYVASERDFDASYVKVHKTYPYPLIQEYIPPGGGAYGVCALFDAQSQPKAVFVHRRLREYPVSGGPSTLRESVHHPKLVELGIQMLKALNWYGVAMVEWKVDPRDGEPKLMEVNPKFWGSIELAIYSGVDFPYLLYQMAVEGDVPPVFEYKDGIQCRWLLGELLHFIYNPNRLKIARSFFRFFGKDLYYDVISKDDLRPVFGLFQSYLGRVFDQ